MVKGFFHSDGSGADYRCECCKKVFGVQTFSGAQIVVNLEDDFDKEERLVLLSMCANHYDGEGNRGSDVCFCPRCVYRLVERAFAILKEQLDDAEMWPIAKPQEKTDKH